MWPVFKSTPVRYISTTWLMFFTSPARAPLHWKLTMDEALAFGLMLVRERAPKLK
jgi:hypothetical protein